MSVTTESAQQFLDRTRHRVHPRCVVCSEESPCALGLHFRMLDDGSVETTFDCPNRLQGYLDCLHGGVISSLLDGAMTNCLFAHGIVAVTADLKVRFRHPVRTDASSRITARITRFSSPLHVGEAELEQEGRVKARAVGKFMERQPRGHEGGE